MKKFVTVGNSVEYYDIDHHIAVIRERRKLGLPVPETKTLVGHELTGKKIRNNETGKIYNIERVCEQWNFGNYIVLLIEHNKSHSVVYWQNVNTVNPITVELIEENQQKFELV